MKRLLLIPMALVLMHCSGGTAPEAPADTPASVPAETGWLKLEGAWEQTSYVKADTQVRYQTDGYMIFVDGHWLHVSFFNRDPRPQDFSEAHHGTYRVTGPDTVDLHVDMELHMDPKSEFQETPVFYGEPDSIAGATYKQEGDVVTMDFPSGAQVVLKRIR